MNLNTQNDLLLNKLMQFYNLNDNLDKALNIINGKSSISLRIVDWFTTNYSKKNNTNYKILYKKGSTILKKQFIVYLDYKLQLKGYSKKQFDPFCRRERIKFYYNHNKHIVTTVGQLNFFRWAIKHDIIKYIEANINDIETDMNNSYKEVYNMEKPHNERRKRQELSISATRTVNKHSVKIMVSFD